ncbi:MAG: helix-turn-helix domain-containing protein [Desulfobacteraceae bacterium]|nr:helix-turn-helix domain-containing protein [Desulfobacteraceae bacterium]
MTDKLICVAKVAKRLDCSRRYVYTLIHNGKLAALRIGEKYGLRVPESSLLNFMKTRRINAADYDS